MRNAHNKKLKHKKTMFFPPRYVKLNSIEHRKGEDHFSMDKALFFAFLYENFGDKFLQVHKTKRFY